MEIAEPVLEKDVTDYDFMFSNGVKIPLTLDLSVGDTVDETPDTFVVTLAAKPRATDPTKIMPKETVHVYKSNLVALVVRDRKQRVPTPEETFALAEAMKTAVAQPLGVM